MEENIEEILEESILPTITIYLDSQFRAHTVYEEGFLTYETSFFNDREYLIPFYRVIPEGYSWVRKDGVRFFGEMTAPIPNNEEES